MIFILLNYVYEVQAQFFFFFQHVFILWHSCTWCLLLCTGKCRTRRHFTHTQQIEMWQKRWESCQIFRLTSGLPINDILLLFKVILKSKSLLSCLILAQPSFKCNISWWRGFDILVFSYVWAKVREERKFQSHDSLQR